MCRQTAISDSPPMQTLNPPKHERLSPWTASALPHSSESNNPQVARAKALDAWAGINTTYFPAWAQSAFELTGANGGDQVVELMDSMSASIPRSLDQRRAYFADQFHGPHRNTYAACRLFSFRRYFAWSVFGHRRAR